MKAIKTQISVLLLLIGTVLFCTACGNEEKSESTESILVTGRLEKGPFVQGSKVTLYELDSRFAQTGKSYTTKTTDDLGAFAFASPLSLPAKYVELETNGYFYNETTGQLSQSTITLNALAEVSNGKANVNLITHLEADRVRRLLQEEHPFAEAKKQAERELLACFAITRPIERPENISLTDGSEEAKILLAISSILLYNRTEAGFSELIAKFSQDFAANGSITDSNIRQAIQSGQYNISPKTIVKRMKEYYEEKGVNINIEEFSAYVDHNGDGTLDDEDDFLDLVPGETIEMEEIFQTESTIQAVLNGTYAKLRDFCTRQLAIEAIRTGKITGRYPDEFRIDANSNLVSDLWQSGYGCIQLANMMLEKLPELGSLPEAKLNAYMGEAGLIRAFTYYNLAMLWDRVPLVTIPYTIGDNPYRQTQSSREEVLTFALNETEKALPLLSDVIHSEVAPEYTHCFMTRPAALALQAELLLTLGRESEAATLLNQTEWEAFAGEQAESIYHGRTDCSIFSLPFNESENTASYVYNQYLKKGEMQPVYTYAHILLLRKEAAGIDNAYLPAQWTSTVGADYGYWAMLKRTKTATDITGCKKHELLLPIPAVELQLCPNFRQNPGY